MAFLLCEMEKKLKDKRFFRKSKKVHAYKIILSPACALYVISQVSPEVEQKKQKTSLEPEPGTGAYVSCNLSTWQLKYKDCKC